MVATIYDDQVDRLDPILKEGTAYDISRMNVEPIISRLLQMFANNLYECRFTSISKVYEIPNMSEWSLPFFPPFIPCDKIFQYTLDNDVYVGKWFKLFVLF